MVNANAAPQITRPLLVQRWLYAVAFIVALMVSVGGFVRLSRAGLSIVEWDVVTGVLPPMGDVAWDAEFSAYKQSPEGQMVNADMALPEYKRIFLIEWFHRLVARLAGLFLVLPLAWFLFRGIIPWRRSGPYLFVALLFGFQGFLGWYMVTSGLVDRPSVSHLRLATHLIAALILLALTLWTALSLGDGDGDGEKKLSGDAATGADTGTLRIASEFDRPRRLGVLLMALVVLQIAYGAFVAGLKAGHISNTWPLMFGQLVPAGLLSQYEPAWRNLFDAHATVHFIHRWLAFGVLLAAIGLWWLLRSQGGTGLKRVRRLSAALALVVAWQILLGIGTILMNVAMPMALLHQATGVLVFALVVVVNFGLRRPQGSAGAGA
jgi:cytochrome c oxidase assembly protein subunit 15